MTALESRYRVLLRAYPRDYRRRHGLELITTLMDAARPGQERPDRADVLDLVRGGLRQRFRLPAGRATLAFAIVAALFAAGLGAAGGAWAGWRFNKNPVPADAEILRIAGVALGRTFPGGTTVSHNHADGLVEVFPWTDSATLGWDAQDARDAATRIAAEGWDAGPIETGLYRTGPEYDLHRTAFVAERDGLLLLYTAEWPDTSAVPHSYVGVSIRPALPWTAHAGGVAGAVLAAIAAWLFVAWAGYRLRRAEFALRVAGTLCAVTTLVALTLPVVSIWVDGVRAALPDPLLVRGTSLLWSAFDAFDGFYLAAAIPFLLVTAVIAGAARRSAPLPAAERPPA
ncbi:hypothetical protein J2S43_002119 [Catenuloplanes nepalensis]|uniref:Uncharacterized protein n=1 Tax=Catenuloplanes nepalensis TaxID=587533 RepID=A0ABT9MQC1_9ACTN|nr:hypothetical protein [Catenuloplanes nepalensis]MDP9793607.1 hypothetical protein [Catenuloplanes nepalensis]